MSCSTLNLTIACQPGFGGHDLPSLVGDRPQGKLIKIRFPSGCLLIIGEAVLPVHLFVKLFWFVGVPKKKEKRYKILQSQIEYLKKYS